MKNGISLGGGALWVLIWVGFMFFYTLLDVAVWKKICPAGEKYLNLLSIAACTAAFLILLARKNQFQVDLFGGITLRGILLAAGCAVLFYLLLDKGLDPVLERLFPASEADYRQALRSLGEAPAISFLRICVLAPVTEEILMRGFLLGGLSVRYGSAAALLVSALLFALLHFNMVQTLSAFVCGIFLGLLYLHTGSLFCCVLAHSGYNLIACMTAIFPLGRRPL